MKTEKNPKPLLLEKHLSSEMFLGRDRRYSIAVLLLSKYLKSNLEVLTYFQKKIAVGV